MKDVSLEYLARSPNIKLAEPRGPKYNDSTDCLRISCHTSELLESFNLSTLSSPIQRNKSKEDFKALSGCSSPYPEILEKENVYKKQEKKGKSKLCNIDLFLDSYLRKREGCVSTDEEELVEYTLNFTKQLHRVKYYWRGTSLNYPFTYMRLKGDVDKVICQEDYSNKKVNPNDGFFN